jgi:hypothetical protein
MGNTKKKGGLEYLEKYPKFKKWVHQCVVCHDVGRKPTMPEHVGGTININHQPYDLTVAKLLKQKFDILVLNDQGICKHCYSLLDD